MKDRFNLIEGRIIEKLFKLLFLIMGILFIQMGYNMIDMIWVGKVGSKVVVVVGIVGFFLWFVIVFIMILKVGGEIKVV